jgi:hypothetical protein
VVKVASGTERREERDSQSSDKVGLSANRRKEERLPVENDAYAGMLRRMLKAYGRRVAGGDVEDLAQMVELGRLFDEVMADAVKAMREEQGYSWTDVGRAVGVTRQAARQKWGER